MSDLAIELGICLESIHFKKEQTKIAKQRQLFSAIASRTREIPEEDFTLKLPKDIQNILSKF